MACVYILYSKKLNRTYTGSSHANNPNHRINTHNKGRTKSTKHGKPWTLIHTEYFKNYKQARIREIFLIS